MANAHMLSIDLAKRSFQVCATDRAGSVLYNRTISRPKLEALLKKQPRCIVAMEACATSHFWGRFAGAEGHEVRLIPPIYVKPFMKLWRGEHNLSNREVAIMRRNARGSADLCHFLPTFLRIFQSVPSQARTLASRFQDGGLRWSRLLGQFGG